MSRLITRIHAIQHRTERARIKREAKQEGFSHYNTNKKIEPLAQMSETLDWHPKIEEELIRLNLVVAYQNPRLIRPFPKCHLPKLKHISAEALP